MSHLLKKAVKMQIINPIDFYFGQFISKNNSIVMLVATCVSYENKNGHIFLPISYFEKHCFFSTTNKKFVKKILNILGEKINWLQVLCAHSSVSNGSYTTPLVLIKKKIYLYKMWKSEINISEFLNQKKNINRINYHKYSKILENLFPEKVKNTQKIAVALTLINNITFIIGGPGTGKTTTILKIIIALIKISKRRIKIQLSAPTGKATTNLTEITKNNIFNIYLTQKEKKSLPSTALTVHQLLGFQKISQKRFFNKNNFLHLDVLIIDETSMIDILMIEQIFLVVSKSTKLIFIGDSNQLSPIEPGSILKSITYYAKNGYSNKTLLILEKITKYQFKKKENKEVKHFISNNICMLKKNYRFNKNSGIHTLSHAIRNNKTHVFEKLFTNSIENVFFYETNSTKQYNKMIENIILNYQDFWEKIKKQADMKEIIESFQDYQVLCVLRDSIFGSYILNKRLEQEIHKKYIVKYFFIHNEIWYIGKPVIVTTNNKILNLFNGNIGITNMNKQGILQVSFLKEKNIIQNIPISILRNYETAWVITVHKAQGSEFMNTSLILPNFESNVLNKDTLYTGVTRSRNILNIFSKKEIFIKTALKNTKKNNLIEIKNLL